MSALLYLLYDVECIDLFNLNEYQVRPLDRASCNCNILDNPLVKEEFA